MKDNLCYKCQQETSIFSLVNIKIDSIYRIICHTCLIKHFELKPYNTTKA